MSNITQRTDNAKIWTATELLSHDFPPIPWIVPGFVTSGLSLLAGSPKVGKSWLALGMSYAVACGGAVLGTVRVEQSEALYLSLEDTPRRIQSRLQAIGATATDNLHVVTGWRTGTEGIADLRHILEARPGISLVIVDTWGRFWPVRDGNDYAEVTLAASQIKALADEMDAAIILVHHNKKGAHEDFVDGVLGSTGLAAAADTTLSITRGRGNRGAVLNVTGRDVEEESYALNFDKDVMTWTLEGTTGEIQESNARQEIYNLIRDEGSATPKHIAEALGKNGSTTRNLLRRMVADGALTSMSGHYAIAQSPRTPIDDIDNATPKDEIEGPKVASSTLSTVSQREIDEEVFSEIGIF